jgi:serine O-acetyltransferase
MLDHMHLVDERMNAMCGALKKLDGSFSKEDVQSINEDEIDCFKQVKNT